MSKYYRNQPVISRNADEFIEEDHWLKAFERNLQKGAVQTREQVSLFDQINSVMNSNSKYPSVEAAVKDMQERSGLIAYINKMSKVSNKKVAANEQSSDTLFAKCPDIKRTLENYVKSMKGYESVPAIVSKIKSIHQNDVDSSFWDNKDLIIFISKLNGDEKKNNADTDLNYSQLGNRENDSLESEDPSNRDAFHALTPTKY